MPHNMLAFKLISYIVKYPLFIVRYNLSKWFSTPELIFVLAPPIYTHVQALVLWPHVKTYNCENRKVNSFSSNALI